jgi:hypothetical protein
VGVNSKEKGQRGEREAAQAWIDAGLGKARRGQQYSGVEGKDVVLEVAGIHIEVKRTESLSLYKAMEQAVEDAGHGEVPIVLHRRNQKKWLVIVELGRLMELVEQLSGAWRSRP